MIINIKKAILHILDANSGVKAISDNELSLDEENIVQYICTHVDKVCDDPAMRTGTFKENSGFLYKLMCYKNNELDFCRFSAFVAEKLYEVVGDSDETVSFDVLVLQCMLGEREHIAILKCDNKVGYVHQIQKNNEDCRNEIKNHYAIMPTLSQRFSEYAFVDIQDYKIKYKKKSINTEGEKIDLFADGLLECDFYYSSKESFNKMSKLAKKVTEEFAGNEIDTEAKIKGYVKDTAIETQNIDVEEVAEAVFSSPSAKEEFIEKAKVAEIPATIPLNPYVTKRVNKNIKIVTDTGIEISFPAEFYKDEENIFITNNEDGTISIQINNVSQIINK